VAVGDEESAWHAKAVGQSSRGGISHRGCEAGRQLRHSYGLSSPPLLTKEWEVCGRGRWGRRLPCRRQGRPRPRKPRDPLGSWRDGLVRAGSEIGPHLHRAPPHDSRRLTSDSAAAAAGLRYWDGGVRTGLDVGLHLHRDSPFCFTVRRTPCADGLRYRNGRRRAGFDVGLNFHRRSPSCFSFKVSAGMVNPSRP
jgi:hypothetical protein